MNRHLQQRISLIISFATFIALLTPLSGQARTCLNESAIFQKNRSLFAGDSRDHQILILPFINETQDAKLQWLSEAFRLGLFLMLEHGKNTDVIEVRSSQTSFDAKEAVGLGKMVGADHVITGVFRKGKGTLKIFVRFVNVSGKKSIPIEENEIEWPNPKKYAELMTYIARRASKAFKGVRVDKKKLQMTENNPRAALALQYWTMAQLVDAKATEADIKKARNYYQESIKNDFNYCYGYLGLAQTLAEIGFLKKLQHQAYQKYFQGAQKELTKAALLCPETAETWGQRVTQYLHANTLVTAGEDRLRKGNVTGATEALEQATKLLPGDVSAHQILLQAYRQQGMMAKAQEEQAIINELTQCR